MRNKIYANQNKKYSKSLSAASFEAFVSKDGGWTDYLISESIIFSHRSNDYNLDDLPEKLHSHDYYELTISLAEKGVVYITDGQTISLRPGMAILTKPTRFHMFRLTEAMQYERYVLYFKDIHHLLPDPAILDFTKRGSNSCAVFNLSEEVLLSHLKSIEELLSDTASPYANAKASLSLFRLFMLLSDGGNAVEYASPLPPPHFIHEIKQYIDENYRSIHSVKALSDQFFYSREYVSRIFRKYYNTPIHEYILGRKMQHSTLLLKKGKSVEKAAHASGFGNLSSFVKLFRKFYGCTPSEYKAKHINGMSP